MLPVDISRATSDLRLPTLADRHHSNVCIHSTTTDLQSGYRLATSIYSSPPQPPQSPLSSRSTSSYRPTRPSHPTTTIIHPSSAPPNQHNLTSSSPPLPSFPANRPAQPLCSNDKLTGQPQHVAINSIPRSSPRHHVEWSTPVRAIHRTSVPRSVVRPAPLLSVANLRQGVALGEPRL